MHTKFWSENLQVRYHAKDLAVDRRIILEWILGTWWIGCIWLSIGVSGGLF